MDELTAALTMILGALPLLAPVLSVYLFRPLAHSPIKILMNVVAMVTNERSTLSTLSANSLKNDSDIVSLRLADTYFHLREEERASSASAVPTNEPPISESTEPTQADSEPRGIEAQRSASGKHLSPLRKALAKAYKASSLYAEKFLLEFVLIVGGTVFVGVMSIAIFNFIVTHGIQLVQMLLSVGPKLILGFCTLLLVFWLLERFSHRRPVLQYAYDDWIDFDSLHWAGEINEKRKRVNFVLSEIDKADSPPLSVIDDPDLEPGSLTNTPLTPGVTEITLSRDSASLDEMRRRLTMVGNFHWRLAVASSGAFFLSLGMALYAAVFMESKAYGTIFGGLGLGVVLGTFTFLTLKNVRTANIAISLFESYLIELSSNLEYANALPSEVERAKAKSAAWLEFRKGLNALWKTESAQKLPPKRAR